MGEFVEERLCVDVIRGLLTGESVESVPFKERYSDAAKPWCKGAVQAQGSIADCDAGDWRND